MRERPSLGHPAGVDGPWLAAILDVLGDLHDLLDSRLPGPSGAAEPTPSRSPARVVPISEPAPDRPPTRAVPVSEPDPDNTPETDDEESEGPEVDLPAPPPRAGRGSGLDAWRAFADAARVPYAEDDRRDDVIAACVRAGTLPLE